MNSSFRSNTNDIGGWQVGILLILFVLALYLFYSSGFSAFAAVCLLPLVVIFLTATFGNGMFLFWILCLVNYFIQWKNFPIQGIPMSLPNEALELLLLILAVIKVKDIHPERMLNVMLMALIIWGLFCTLEVLNNTHGMGIDIGAWYAGARMVSFQLVYAFLVFTIYINDYKRLLSYLYLWAGLSIFASFWVWKQQNIGLTTAENSFLHGRGSTTHIINSGATIRYFSVFSDAANFGINMAASAVAFIIFGITSRIKKHKYFFFFAGFVSLWGMMPSGTRTAMFCVAVGFAAYIFLSRSFKIAAAAGVVLLLGFFIVAFTGIGNSNAQVRRMRSGLNTEDKSANQRTINQAIMKKYLQDAPWGLGIGVGYDDVPANNKYNKLATIPPDSEYVYIWIHTGRIGLTLFIIVTLIMFGGACRVVLFKLKNKSLTGIGAGLCCAFVSLQLGGYGNQVMMQFPNCLIFYGGLTLVYVLPFLEKEWSEYENKLFEAQEEKRRLKREKKLASRV